MIKWKWLPTLLLPLVGIIVPIILFSLSINKKKLSYEFLSKGNSVVNAENINIENIKILYRDKAVKNIELTLIKLVNDGNMPIQRIDFDQNLIIEFPKEVSILRAVIYDRHPANLDPEILQDKNVIQIKPTLLNPNDSFVLQLLTSGNYKEPKLTARIVGVNSIEQKGGRSSIYDRPSIMLIIALGLMAVYGGLGGAIRTTIKERRPTVSIKKIEAFVIAFVTLLGSVSIMKHYFHSQGYWPLGYWPLSPSVTVATLLVTAVSVFWGLLRR